MYFKAKMASSARGACARRSLFAPPTPDVALSTLEDHSHPAWQRLKAEELLAQRLSQYQSRRERDRLRAPVLRPSLRKMVRCPCTNSSWPCCRSTSRPRSAAGEEIAADLARRVPMHRLLQGDVGSGKTIGRPWRPAWPSMRAGNAR